MAIVRRTTSGRAPGILPANPEYHTATEVHEVARRKGIATRPFDILKLVRIHNIAVVHEEMADNDISGYIEHRAGGWVIGINKYHNPRRQRFTLAHEFAHFCLHKDAIERETKITDAILFRDASSSNREKEANEFASQVLIPDDVFRQFVGERTRSITELADLFGVSPAAVRYKAFKLGFIREY